jgi:hypothetical protein
MENEIPFTMEAEEQARLQTEEDAFLNFRKRAGSNNIKPTTEETPLLSRETQNSTTEGATSGAGDDPEARFNKPWLGGAEWEGSPFWKRPSVSQNTDFTLMCDADSTLIRSGGCFLPSYRFR